MKRMLAFAIVVLFAAKIGAAEEVAAPTFEKHVRPIFKAKCFHCHGEGEETKGGLDLRLRRFIARGGDSGAAIVPGSPGESYLVERLRAGEMPPGEDDEKLTAEEIELVERWVAAGAATARSEPETITGGIYITEEDRQFWSFRAVVRPKVPRPQHAERIRNPIDAFLLRELERHGESFAPEADRQTLIRRASFDLTGLPPSPEVVERFVADDLPGAYARLVDRLLASPHYGERWGRHWLDVAGYADSEGYTAQDQEREHAFRYRDYVIRSLNADKPFNQFIREQIAGDEMIEPPYDNLTAEEAEKLIATGFLRMAPDGTGGAVEDPLEARDQTIADSLEIVSTSLLGLTVGCARCHNHRYDPISQEDYYRLRAVFEPAYNLRGWRAPRQRLISLYTDADRELAREIEEQAKKIDERKKQMEEEAVERVVQRLLEDVPEEDREDVRAAYYTPRQERTGEQKRLLVKYSKFNFTARNLRVYDREAYAEIEKVAQEAEALRATKPVERFARALTEVPGMVPRTVVFHRGDYQQPGKVVRPGELTVLKGIAASEIPVNDPALPTTGRRLAYAKHLTDGSHPLVARVIVNRVWMHHFGRGLCNTPADFGALGEKPSHPELLDWLASEFVENAWSLKRLHRLIMTSAAYRQSLRRRESLVKVDPENRLLGGMRVRRLEAEVIRDSMLAVTGKLNPKRFGPPVPVMPDPVGQFVVGIENSNAGIPNEVIPMHGEEFRRSVYVQSRRSRPLTFMETFDAPPMDPNCERRTASTVAPQSLMLMNSNFMMEQSRYFAQRVRREAGDEPRRQAERAWKLAFSRSPSAEELDEAAAFLEARIADFRADPPATHAAKVDGEEEGEEEEAEASAPDPEFTALAVFCQALMSSNEFLYVD